MPDPQALERHLNLLVSRTLDLTTRLMLFRDQVASWLTPETQAQAIALLTQEQAELTALARAIQALLDSTTPPEEETNRE